MLILKVISIRKAPEGIPPGLGSFLKITAGLAGNAGRGHPLEENPGDEEPHPDDEAGETARPALTVNYSYQKRGLAR
jgi:hypothetical protein